MDSYVTICPSGLETVVQQIIHDSIVSTRVHPALSSVSASNAGNNTSILDGEGKDNQMKSEFQLYHECRNMTILNEPISKEGLERIKTKLCAQKLKKEHRQQKRKMKANAVNPSVEPPQSSSSSTTSTTCSTNNQYQSNNHHLYGTVRIENTITTTPSQSPPNSNHTISEINIGYNVEETILSYPGCLEGKSLIYFETNAPPKFIYSIRASGCGPLLTMITSTSTTTSSATTHAQQPCHNSKPFLQYDDDLDKAITLFESFLKDIIGRDEYLHQLDKALSLWTKHVDESWSCAIPFHETYAQVDNNRASAEPMKRKLDAAMDNDGKREETVPISLQNTTNNINRSTINLPLHEIQSRIQRNKPLRFRVSCVRSHSKKYKYSNSDFTQAIAGMLVPSSPKEIQQSTRRFIVDLDNYDFELVVLIHTNHVMIGISLRPYNLVGATSFSKGNGIPPDITYPYIKGKELYKSKNIVRLRPSVASILLHLAQVKSGDVVLDPCSGVGTIPMEASIHHEPTRKTCCFGIGGDIALAMEKGLGDMVSDYLHKARLYQQKSRQCATSSSACGDDHDKSLGHGGGCEMLSWDASLLPIRHSSIDCIISDLPFGQRCLSKEKLDAFLPLLFLECSRVLRPSGRLILLCGHYQTTLTALEASTCNKYYQMPPRAIMPVNIGGLSAWILIFYRNNQAIDKSININSRRRVKKMSMKRKQTFS